MADVGLDDVARKQAIGAAEAVCAISIVSGVLVIGRTRSRTELIVEQNIRRRSDVKMPKARGRKPVVDVDIQSVGPLVARRIVGDCNVAEIGRVDLIWRGTGKLAPVSKNKSAGKSRPGTLGVKIGGDRGVIETANLVLGDLVVVDREGQALDLLRRVDDARGVGLRLGCLQVRVAQLVGAALDGGQAAKGAAS